MTFAIQIAYTTNNMYSVKLMSHFRKPRNMGRLKNADGIGEVGNPVCGDIMRIYIKVSNNKLKNVKFETLGCPAAIGTSSMVTDLAKNKTLEQALKITNKDVAKALNGLPSIKMHCSNLAADALHEAINNYNHKLKGKKENKSSIVKKRACCSKCKK